MAATVAAAALSEYQTRASGLGAEIKRKQGVLAELHAAAAAVLPAGTAAQVRSMEARASELRARLLQAERAWEEQGTGGAALAQLQKELSQVRRVGKMRLGSQGAG